MFSSLFSRAQALVLVATLIAGCGMPVGEKPPPPSKPKLKLGFDTKCFKEIKPAVSNWMDAKATDAEIDSVSACLEGAAEIVKSKVVGEKLDELSKEELRQFLKDYVLNGSELSAGFMSEIMALKQVLVGGDELKITRSEFDNLKSLVVIARDILKKTNPNMLVYTMKWQPSEDTAANEALFAKSEATLRESVASLMAAFEANKNGYDMNRLPVLLEEIRVVAGADWTFIPQVRDYLPLVSKLKKSLVGGTDNIVAGSEWRRFGSAAARGFAQLLRYEYFLKDQKEIFGENADLRELERLGNGVLEMLTESVEQKPSAVLSREELVELLTSARVAFPSLELTEGFVTELLAIKEALFGGTAEGLTASDLRNARGKLPQIRAIIEGLLKYKRYYLLSEPSVLLGKTETDAIAYAQVAEKNLVAIGEEISKLFVQGYDLNRLEPLVREAGVVGFDLKKYLPLLVAVKNLYFQDEGPIVEVKQYGGVFALATRGYSRFVEYHYFLKEIIDAGNYELLSIWDGRRSLGRLVNDGLALLQSFVTRRNPQAISVAELMKVWGAARKAGLLPEGLTDETAKATLQKLFETVLLEPEIRLSKTVPKGLTLHAFNYLRVEFGAWYGTQVLLEEFRLAPSEQANQRELVGLWDAALSCLKSARGGRLGCPDVIPADAQRYATVANLSKVVTEMRRVFTSQLPMSHASQRRLVIGDKFRRYDNRSLSYINLSRAIARLLVQGYASKMGAPGSNVWLASREDANRALMDFKPLAVALDFIEEDNTSFATMRFLEANLFTPQGNGDSYLDLREGTGIIAHILSGLSHNSTIEKRIREEHCVGKIIPDAKGVKKKDRVPIACLLHAYRSEMSTRRGSEPTLAVALPEFASYMLGLSSSVTGANSEFDIKKAQPYDLMMMDLMSASGWKNEDSKTAVMKDVALVAHVMQYIETVMQRFDGSVTGVKNGVLTRKEAMNGYPLFRATVNELLTKDDTVAAISEQLGDSLTKASYAYVLYHGGVPTCSTDKAELLKWALFPEAQKTIATQRNKLAEILGILAAAARKKPNEALPSKCYYTVAP